jgi:beta-N-acetylhexosaminidase
MRYCHGMLVLIIPCGYDFSESSIRVTLESGWDMASLTKIMVTTPCVMVLYDRDLIALEQVACKYLPEFGNNGKEIITVRQLLTHTAGLHEFYPFFDMGLTKREEVKVQLQFLDRLIWNISSNAWCQEFLFASCRPQ